MRTDREFRRKVEDARAKGQVQNMIERYFHERTHVDMGTAPEVSPPSGRVAPVWKKRKPVFKGGTVIGRRDNYGTA